MFSLHGIISLYCKNYFYFFYFISSFFTGILPADGAWSHDEPSDSSPHFNAQHCVLSHEHFNQAGFATETSHLHETEEPHAQDQCDSKNHHVRDFWLDVVEELREGRATHIVLHNEPTMDSDNIFSLTLASQLVAKLNLLFPSLAISQHFHVATTYVGARNCTPSLLRALDHLANDKGTLPSGLRNFYLGFEPSSQAELRRTYETIPQFFGNMDVFEEEVKAGLAREDQLMFARIPRKAHGALDFAFDHSSAAQIGAYRHAVRPLSDLQKICNQSDRVIHIVLAPPQTLTSLTIRPQDRLILMGGTYQRGEQPRTLSYNVGASVYHSNVLLQHAERSKVPLFFVTTDFCDRFKVRPLFWHSLIRQRNDLELSAIQQGFLDHAVLWEAYLSDRLAPSADHATKIVLQKSLVPIFSDPLALLVAFQGLFKNAPLGLPDFFQDFFEAQSFNFKLKKVLNVEAGGYLGTRSSDRTRSYIQHPSDFFELNGPHATDFNAIMTVTKDTIKDEYAVAEEWTLTALGFSSKQRKRFMASLESFTVSHDKH